MASKDDLEKRVLERRVLVTLYRVHEWRGEVNWDSLYGYHSRVDTDHGLYRSEARARKAQRKRVTDLLNDGWHRSAQGPDWLYTRGQPSYEACVGITRHKVNEESISRDRDGMLYYRKQRIR